MSYLGLYLFISFLILIGGITYLTILKDFNFKDNFVAPILKEKDATLNNNAETLVAGYGTVLIFYCAFLLSMYNWGLSKRPDIDIIILFVLIFSAFVIFLKGPELIKENGLLILASTLGIILMLEHSSLIGLYIGVEAYSLCGYCLASGFNISIKTFKAKSINKVFNKFASKKENFNNLTISTEHLQTLEKVSIEAGLKYFLLSALSSGLLLAGMSLIYGCTGSFRNDEIYRIYSLYIENSVDNKNFIEKGIVRNLLPYYSDDKTDIATYSFYIKDLALNGIPYLKGSLIDYSESSMPLFTLLYTGVSLITGAMIFKIGGAPFHNWVADVYEKVSTTTTFYLILVPKIGLSYVLFILSSSMSTSLIYFSALISFIVGAFGGLVQKNLIRLIAFSSINHVAYICSAIYALSLKTNALKIVKNELVSNSSLELTKDYLVNNLELSYNSLTNNNNFALIVYLIIYGITTLGFFSIYYVLQNYNFKHNTELNSFKNFKYIYSLKRLFYSSPYLAIALTICIFSMAGVPPFAGFLAKFAVYSLLLEKGCFFLAFIAVITSIIVLAFYLGIVKTLYFSESTKNKKINFELSALQLKTINLTPGLGLYSYNYISSANALLISFTSMLIIFYPFIMQNIAYLFYFDCSFF